MTNEFAVDSPEPTILVLGPVAVRDASGLPRTLSGQQAEVLSLLVAAAPDPVRVETLVDVLWGVSTPKTASTGLRVVVARLRDRLADGIEIVAEAGHYRLNVPPEALDHKQFSARVASARALLLAFEYEKAIDQLRAALGLWRGEAFQPHNDNDAIWPHAAKLGEERADAEELFVEALLASGRLEEAVARCTRLVADNELRDRRWYLLMLGLYRAGRQAEALRTYQRVASLYRDNLGLEPGPTLVELEQAILQQDPGLLVIARAGGPHPDSDRITIDESETGSVGIEALVSAIDGDVTAVPASASPTVGRDRELDQLAEVLQSHRLVSIIGPPGVGKTRLAASFARGFDRGRVLWLDLAVHRPENAVADLASQLGVRVEADSVVAEVAAALRHGESLLVFDNCERFVDTIVPLAESLIKHCPDLRILATSRQVLDCPSETRFELGAIDLGDARRLLLERAFGRNQRPSLDDHDLDQLVERLDRLPLALELASGLLRSSTPAEILGELENTTTILTRSRQSTDRHQSLSMALAWSTDRLDPEELSVFTQLGAFRGTFHSADVATMLGVDNPSANRVLGRLTANSLVSSRRDRPVGEYRILETIRAHARDLLVQSNGLSRAESRHASAYVDLLQWAQPRWRGQDEERAVRRVGAASGEIRHAFEWALGAEELDVAIAIANLVWDHALFRMDHEQQRWALDVLETHDTRQHPHHGALLGTAAMSCWVLGRFEDGLAYAQQASEASHESGQPISGQVLRARLNIAGAQSDVQAAETAAMSLLEHSRLHHDDWERSAVLCSIAMGWAYVGDRDVGEKTARKSLDLAQGTNNASAIAWSVFGRGFVTVDHDPAEALSLFRESLRLSGTVRNRWVQGMATAGAVTAHRRLGQTSVAASLLADLIPHWRRGGMVSILGNACHEAALVLDDLGHRDLALEAIRGSALVGQRQLLLPKDEQAITKLRVLLDEAAAGQRSSYAVSQPHLDPDAAADHITGLLQQVLLS